MKHASLLIALCVLLSSGAFAQSTTTLEKNAKRITITTKKTDENGKTVTETYIAEGEEPGKILEEMAINAEVIQKVEVYNGTDQAEEEKIFMFRRAGENGENVVIHRSANDNENINNAEGEKGIYEKVIIIDNKDSKGAKECYKMYKPHEGFGHASVWVNGHDSKSNCAALGVFVHDSGESGGTRINALIENGGAKEAGLQEGDVIVKIEEFDVTEFSTLHLALSHFRPGDVVTVRYDREGKTKKARVELKDWAQLPGHEWRARTDCGKETVIEEKPIEKRDDPPGLTNIQPLELQDAMIYPNPTSGLFAFSFETAPGPLSVTITDVNGKVVYNENNENPLGMYNREIDLKEMPSGNYIISVTQGEKVYTEQISKQ